MLPILLEAASPVVPVDAYDLKCFLILFAMSHFEKRWLTFLFVYLNSSQLYIHYPKVNQRARNNQNGSCAQIKDEILHCDCKRNKSSYGLYISGCLHTIGQESILQPFMRIRHHLFRTIRATFMCKNGGSEFLQNRAVELRPFVAKRFKVQSVVNGTTLNVCYNFPRECIVVYYIVTVWNEHEIVLEQYKRSIPHCNEMVIGNLQKFIVFL